MKRKNETEIKLHIADLKLRIDEAIETLAAIRKGQVDALVVSTPKGEQLVTLEGVDPSYRGMFETLSGHVPQDIQGLIHQLKAHHEELETQNEELRRMQVEIEKAHRMYRDLYDLAPVGYFLFDGMGVIHSANFTGAKMVGWTQHDILGLPFTLFIHKEDARLFLDHLRNVFNNHSNQTELRVLGNKKQSAVQVRLQSAIVEEIEGGSTFCRTALIDITERTRAEEALRKAHDAVQFFASQCLTAQETERKRIAAELHDSIAASLATMKLRIGIIVEEMKQGNGHPESLEEVASEITEVNNEVRRIMTDLRPPILDNLGIIPALDWFCREYRKIYSDISVEKQVGISEHEVPDSLKTPIFRISQEAMNNVAKHSRASLVNLSLRKEDDQILLTIEDNGQGFDPETVRRGLGLSTMQERSELSGGTWNIESVKGAGTNIRCTWPLKN